MNQNLDLKSLIQLAQGDRTQNEFAMHCGISPAALTRIKNGDYQASPTTLKKISNRAYNNVTYSQLMIAAGFLDDPEKEQPFDPIFPQNEKAYLLARDIQSLDEEALDNLRIYLSFLQHEKDKK